MAEQYPRVAETRNIAAAICATEKRLGDARLELEDLQLGNLPVGENIETIVAKWHDPDRGLFCHLRQDVDPTGTRYFLAVHWEDENSYIGPVPNECYLLPYAAGEPILATDDHGVPHSDADYSDRVRELFSAAEEYADGNEQAFFDTTVMEQHTADAEFRDVVEGYWASEHIRSALANKALETQVASTDIQGSPGEQVRLLRGLVEKAMEAASSQITWKQAANVVQTLRDRRAADASAE